MRRRQWPATPTQSRTGPLCGTCRCVRPSSVACHCEWRSDTARTEITALLRLQDLRETEQSGTHRAAIAAERHERITQVAHFWHQRVVVDENTGGFAVFFGRD